ncbi:26S proteasome non-ATPase regulatory subunit [Wickerhamomyces ciferrii]|uniref:26S proteasome non-ATPase regulatory subunit n=1 Tax=Wickerhamomyces ciferrii (strain ATCC 14091 / BCRC 22168 / CBS 111 / JCM 3599 / NBRC 0793 / NRRL Y-1031 F-60-10) TaxID=1206466 RepID=K0KHA7_WICCF|nr:26S proteasome non-ATPase regulatory subunit [Wickerhamomyces ciferrii]CCH44600.1 26S proteasome non-ATPase regulatory subunit [Wickerhamomyces ciferrii]
MVLEATMIVIDNSEFTRNGDYLTNRFEAQLDGVDLIFHAKTNSNPENTVGLLASGGDGPQILSTLTADFGKLLSGIHETKIHGSLHFATSIQVAALALKHRQNKVQHQRIIAFVGSPIKESEKELEKLAKKMKKNNIAIDFINYGEESVNTSKLEKFISIVNSHDNSHLVTAPPSDRLLYEVIGSSPIIVGEDDAFGGQGGSGDVGGDGFDFGADPNMDPDLALALRLSLEEEQARQAREQQQRDQPETLESINETTTGDNGDSNENNNNNDGDTNMEDAK